MFYTREKTTAALVCLKLHEFFRGKYKCIHTMLYRYKRFKLEDGKLLSKLYLDGTEEQYDKCTRIANNRIRNHHYKSAYGFYREEENDDESFLIYHPS